MKARLLLLASLALISLGVAKPGLVLKPLTAEEIARIDAAVPSKAPVAPAKPRRLLVFDISTSAPRATRSCAVEWGPKPESRSCDREAKRRPAILKLPPKAACPRPSRSHG